PADMQTSTGQINFHFAVEFLLEATGHNGGTGTCTTRESFARAAFKNAQINFRGRYNFHKADIHPLWKARMMLNFWPQFSYRCLCHIINNQDGVRIAHGNSTDGIALAIYIEGVTGGLLLGLKGNMGRDQARYTHIHDNLVIINDLELHDAAGSLYANGAFAGQFALAYENGKAAGAVATVFHFAAITIKNPVTKIHIRIVGGFYQQ